MFPGHVDGRFHIVSQDDKLGRAAVIMGAKTYDVDLSHSGPQNSEKTRGEQEATGSRPTSLSVKVSFWTLKKTDDHARRLFIVTLAHDSFPTLLTNPRPARDNGIRQSVNAASVIAPIF
jgi:hypothetical protein